MNCPMGLSSLSSVLQRLWENGSMCKVLPGNDERKRLVMTTVCLLSSLISKCFSKPCGTFRKTLQHDEELSKIAQPRQSGINREKKINGDPNTYFPCGDAQNLLLVSEAQPPDWDVSFLCCEPVFLYPDCQNNSGRDMRGGMHSRGLHPILFFFFLFSLIYSFIFSKKMFLLS